MGYDQGMSADDWQRRQEERRIASMQPSRTAATRPQDPGPWAAILAEVRRSAERVAWVDDRGKREQERELEYEGKIALAVEAGAAVEGRDPGEAEVLAREAERRRAAEEVRKWLRESGDEWKVVGVVWVKAVSARLAERSVQSVREERTVVVRVLARGLDNVGLGGEQGARAYDE